MIRAVTFSKGGIHPSDKKDLSKNSHIVRLDMPKELTVPLSQHIGAPSLFVKSLGDHVEKGELLGRASSFISANVHSPASGVIKDLVKVTLPSGVVSDAVVIETDSDQPDCYNEVFDWRNIGSKEIVNKITEAGIVGQGGATFPAGVKLNVPEGKKTDALIINCVECEPYLTSDYRLATERTDEFLDGVSICEKAVNPNRVIIGIEANKKDLYLLLQKKINEKKLKYEVLLLKMKYPQGDEKQLIKACVGREVPSGKLPADVGAVVVNVGSAWAIYNAVAKNMPLIERVVTVSGECIKNPSNFIVPVGTPVSYVINAAGGFVKEPDIIISGGPMMGFGFFNLDTPIIKGSGGIICIEDKKTYKQTACLSCGKCVSVCPMGLEPTIMYRLITNQKYEEAMAHDLMDCKECGCCAYTCPANLNLVQAFKLGKKLGRKK